MVAGQCPLPRHNPFDIVGSQCLHGFQIATVHRRKQILDQLDVRLRSSL
jgi:hypothetical protein